MHDSGGIPYERSGPEGNARLTRDWCSPMFVVTYIGVCIENARRVLWTGKADTHVFARAVRLRGWGVSETSP